MSVVYGRAQIVVDVDGERIIPAVRRIARRAGVAGGAEMGRSFNREFSKAISKGDGFKGLTGKMDGLRSALGRLSKSWQGLSHNTRQWSLIIGAITLGIPALTTLISALSGGIVALTTALIGAVTGAGLLVAAFTGLYDETHTLNAGAQASKDAFAALGDAFNTLQGQITNAVFDGMAASINAVIAQVSNLSGIITEFAGVAGAQLGRIFDALASPTALATFTALLEGFKPIIESLTTAAIGFGTAIGNIFVLSLPTAQTFAAAIADVATQFAAWTSSKAGIDAINGFFATAETILPSLVNAVAGLAAQFSSLITPAVIADTKNLLDNLSTGLQFVFDVVKVIGGLDIFGNLIAALSSVSALLTPLTPGLTAIATAIGDALYAALQAVVPLFYSLGAIVGPIVTVFGRLFTSLADALVPVFTTLGDIFTELTPLFVAIGEHIGQIVSISADFFIPVIEEIIAFIGDLLESLLPLIKESLPTLTTLFGIVATAIQAVSPVVSFLANIVTGVLGVAFTAIVGVLQTVVSVVGGVVGALNGLLKPALDTMTKAVKEFGNFWRDVWSEASRFFGDVSRNITGFFTTIIGSIRTAIDWVGRLLSAIGRLDFGAIANLFSGGPRSSGGGGMASGGVLYGPRRILAGEAGPEAIVPLKRSLSQVDPSVRWLSALAQGKHTPAYASGGITGGPSRVIDITQNIYSTQDTRKIAIDAVNRIVERLG